jgi:hypothetical protein
MIHINQIIIILAVSLLVSNVALPAHWVKAYKGNEGVVYINQPPL